MIPSKAGKERHCRTCGGRISWPLYNKRWTQCALCYWKARFERCRSLSTLQKEIGDIHSRLKNMPLKIAESEKALANHRKMIEAQHANKSWWHRFIFSEEFLGRPIDSTLTELAHRRLALLEEESQFERNLTRLKDEIKNAKYSKKRFLERQLIFDRYQKHQPDFEAQRNKFAHECSTILTQEFDRNTLHIQPKDYRRGNAIDNYVRKFFAEEVILAFEKSCAYCGCDNDLTFDHYGLSKNEGGNYILIAKNRDSIKVNLIVLCRGCNSMKGQLSYLTFFDSSKRKAILTHQEQLLNSILQNTKLMQLIKKWAK